MLNFCMAWCLNEMHEQQTLMRGVLWQVYRVNLISCNVCGKETNEKHFIASTDAIPLIKLLLQSAQKKKKKILKT